MERKAQRIANPDPRLRGDGADARFPGAPRTQERKPRLSIPRRYPVLGPMTDRHSGYHQDRRSSVPLNGHAGPMAWSTAAAPFRIQSRARGLQHSRAGLLAELQPV